MIAPTLHTERLTLRAPRESDLAVMAAFGASPRSAFVGGPYDLHRAWLVLLAGIGHWTLRGCGYWSVDRRADQDFVGRVGVICPSDAPEPELAWLLFDGYEGQGYAFVAASAARDHAPNIIGLPALASFIDPANAPSRALAERMGATCESSFFEQDTLLHLWRHPAGPGAA